MGGWNQSQAHAQYVSHIADFNQNIQAAMEAPRFTKLSFEGCDVELENRFPGAAIAELKAKGHLLQMHNGYSNRFGGGQAVMRDFGTGVNYGASDPRKDGAGTRTACPLAGLLKNHYGKRNTLLRKRSAPSQNSLSLLVRLPEANPLILRSLYYYVPVP